MKKSVNTALKIVYLLPLFLLAVNITLFSTGEICGGNFEEDCRTSESQYTFHDFCVFYSAARIAQSPDKEHMYDAATQQKYLEEVRGPGPLKQNTLVMELAPFFPCLLIPFAWLPINLAYTLYFVGSMAAFVGGVLLLRPLLNPRPAVLPTLLVTFCLLGTVPSCITATLSQISFYIFFLVVAYIYCLQNKKDKIAALPLALLGIKPHYAIFMALPALAQKKWLLLALAAALELILLAISVAILGWSTVAGYPAAVLSGDNSGSWTETSVLMINLRGLLYTLGNWPWIFPFTFLCMILAAMALILFWRRGSLDNTQSKSLWALTLVLLLFCSAHAHIYDAVLLFIPMLMFYTDQKSKDRYQKFGKSLLIASPYIQWLGMIILAKNYHRSLPTSVILLTLTVSLALAVWQEQKSKQ